MNISKGLVINVFFFFFLDERNSRVSSKNKKKKYVNEPLISAKIVSKAHNMTFELMI